MKYDIESLNVNDMARETAHELGLDEVRDVMKGQTMSKFTPGPWQTDGIVHESIFVAGEYFVGINCPDLDERGCGHLCYVWANETPHTEAVANACLIAAAPELYEALRKMVAECDMCYGSGHNALDSTIECGHCTHARAALAKADGKTE